MDFLAPETIHPPMGYSHAVVVEPRHRLVFVSGQIGMDVDGTIPSGWEAQARLAFDNLGRALSAAGASWGDVVKLTFFLVSTDELAGLRRIRDEHIDTERPPASSLVRVAVLFRPDVLLEIEAIAAV